MLTYDNYDRQVGSDETAIWANSSAANTEKTVDFGQSSRVSEKHGVYVHNPSGVTALTVKAYNLVSVGGVERAALIATFSVAVGETGVEIIEGLFRGTNGVRLILSNDTALGLADGFTADITIRDN